MQIHCHRLPFWRKYAPEVKAAKGLKRCRAKIKGVNNPAEPPSTSTETVGLLGTGAQDFQFHTAPEIWL